MQLKVLNTKQNRSHILESFHDCNVCGKFLMKRTDIENCIFVDWKCVSAIQHKLAGRIKSVPPNLVSNRAIKTQLGPIHFQQLDEINALLTREYSIRRQMILKRLDCTIESFTWTDRMKG